MPLPAGAGTQLKLGKLVIQQMMILANDDVGHGEHSFVIHIRGVRALVSKVTSTVSVATVEIGTFLVCNAPKQS